MRKRALFLIAVLLTSILSGCTDSSSDPTGNLPADTDSISDTVENADELVSLTTTTLEDVRRSLPEDEQEQKVFVKDTAASICDATEPLDMENLDEQAELTDTQLRRLEDAAEILNDQYEADIDPHHLSALSDHAGTAVKFLPIIASYNKVSRTACDVRVDDEESLEDFYVAVGQFSVGVVLLQQQTMYHTAFKSTRILNNKLSFVTIRKVCGNRCHHALMSEVHWAQRDKLWDVTNLAVESTIRQETGISTEDFDNAITGAVQAGEQARDDAKDWWEGEDGQEARETVDKTRDRVSSLFDRVTE